MQKYNIDYKGNIFYGLYILLICRAKLKTEDEQEQPQKGEAMYLKLLNLEVCTTKSLYNTKLFRYTNYESELYSEHGIGLGFTALVVSIKKKRKRLDYEEQGNEYPRRGSDASA